jgi:hypothetical protein
MIEAAQSVGFADADVILPYSQSTIACRKGA